MDSITLSGKYGSSNILVGESISSLHKFLPKDNVWAITDENLFRIYRPQLSKIPVFVLEAGEHSKTAGHVEKICHWLLDQGAGRDAFILGIGGGVVTDITGFVASVFMRGVDFGFVASSLLAQVDGSIGGKNGVNLQGYKNIIGTFNQPQFVICDTGMLQTLPAVEFKNGMAEVIKHALLADQAMFEKIKQNRNDIVKLNNQVLNYLVKRSVEIKTTIVAADEREAGLRRMLNLGHTWGHAVEKTDGIPHGQAVSIGLAFAADLSVSMGLLSQHDRDQIVELLKNYDLPVVTQTPPTIVFEAMLKDKKKERNHIHFVLMEGIGKARVEIIELTRLKQYIDERYNLHE